MKQWLASSGKSQAEGGALSKQREAALQLQLAEKNLENLTLRQLAFASSQQARPHIAQVVEFPTNRRLSLKFIKRWLLICIAAFAKAQWWSALHRVLLMTYASTYN